MVEHLGQLDFLHGKENVVLLGPPGTGKTHLAIALLNIRRGFAVQASTHSPNKPKIPNVSEEFGVKWLNIVGWCRAEGIKVVRS